jgi:hypothetical protein
MSGVGTSETYIGFNELSAPEGSPLMPMGRV